MPLEGGSEYNIYSRICFLMNRIIMFMARKQDAPKKTLLITSGKKVAKKSSVYYVNYCS